ncbi:MAG: Gfo/Idh/MocA family oxidoreductase [Ignavibacteriae bacterium]|nr:Gfo/Idh/MocA family oxidoreductase [Ignavibacteriota bacterium]
MNKIRYGIIGFGVFAERTILPAIRASANSDIVAIQKRSLEAVQAKAKEHKIPHAFATAEELVKHTEVDAVFIVSVTSTHCPETLAAARAGKHVLTEKPMAMNVSECEEMIRTCKQHNVKLMVGHMVRLSPAVQRMKELMKSGALGHITFIKTEFVYDGRISHRKWLVTPGIAGGGPIFDIGVHCLDTMRFLLDDEVVSVKSELSPLPTPTHSEATATMALRFSRSTVGSIYCSYESAIRRSFIEIVGTEGAITAYEFTRSGIPIELRVVRGDHDKIVEDRIEKFNLPDLYEIEVSLFSDCILNNKPSPIPGEVGLANQRVIDVAVRG